MPEGLAAGQLVDERYALEELLGEDSLGSVWRASDRGLGRPVCVRDVRHDRSRLPDALTAARTAIRLDHPGAIHVWDAFVDRDRLVVVTELTKTRTLASLVERKGPQSVKKVAAIGLDVLEPLAAAHAMGIVHGDIAPSTVLVPDRGRSQLTGFGLAPAFRDEGELGWIEAGGTPPCIAPEQVDLQGNSPAVDLFGLGATLYFAAEGHHAYAGPGAPGFDPPRPPSRAGKLWPLLERLLSRNPDDRPEVDEIRRSLADAAGIVIVGQTEETARRRPRRERRRVTETEAEPTDEVEADPKPEHDWNAPLDAEVPVAPREPTWEEWAAAAGVSSPSTPPESVSVDGEPAAPVPPVDEPRRFRSSPSWPPPGQRRIGLAVLCTLVAIVMVALLVTNGQILGGGDSSSTTVPADQRPVLATDPASVPGDWVAYRHPAVDFSISYPPGWTARDDGKVVTIREPSTGTELRVDYRKPRGPDPHQVWLDAERRLSEQHPNDYRRLQLSPARYLENPAALWEYTYVEGTMAVHAVDLGFHTDDYGFTLNFRAPGATWEGMLPVFRSFLSSVRAPD